VFSVTNAAFGMMNRVILVLLFSSQVSQGLIFPFFIGVDVRIGPHLGFAGCALTGRPTMEVFSLLPLNFHSTNDDAYDALARHLSALKKALNELEAHVQKADGRRLSNTPADNSNRQTRSITRPSCSPMPPNVPHDPIFPYPTLFTPLSGRSDRGLHSFIYEGEMAGRKLLFKAKMQDGTGICVKFVRRYGEDVHMWCAAKGFAPKLIAFEVLPGGWYMVVMDLLDESWVPFDDKKAWIEGLKDNFHATISDLHQAQMVHGDVRDANVMVKDGTSEFMLVDYDWAGSQGHARYPRHINKDPELGRPADVEDGQLILTQHDESMLAQMFRNGRNIS